MRSHGLSAARFGFRNASARVLAAKKSWSISRSGSLRQARWMTHIACLPSPSAYFRPDICKYDPVRDNEQRKQREREAFKLRQAEEWRMIEALLQRGRVHMSELGHVTAKERLRLLSWIGRCKTAGRSFAFVTPEGVRIQMTNPRTEERTTLHSEDGELEMANYEFSTLVDISERERMDDSANGNSAGVPLLLCTSGPASAAALRLLDRYLAEGRIGGRIRYSGDFDVKGIEIGNVLAIRYASHFVSWRFDSGSYKQGGASIEWGLVFTEEERNRLKHMQAIWDRELCGDMARLGRKLFQEQLIAAMVEDWRSSVAGRQV